MIAKIAIFAMFAILLSGCGTFGVPRITLGKTTVAAPKDAGTPGTIARDEERTTVTFPAGTEATVTDVAAQPATQDKPATPAQRVTKFTLPAPTPFELFTTGDAGSFTCVATNTEGTDTSAAAILTVNAASVSSTPQPRRRSASFGFGFTL